MAAAIWLATSPAGAPPIPSATSSRKSSAGAPEDAGKARDEITRSYDLPNLQDTTALLPLPQHLSTRTPTLEDLNAARDQTIKEFSDRHSGDEQAIVNDPEFQRQSVMILRWQEVLSEAAGG